MYDILIIGGGPAGLTAALYGRRAGKSVLILEKNAFGGQITWSPKVENFPTIGSISGLELADRLTEQVMESGAEVELDEVVELAHSGDGFVAKTAFGGAFLGRTVVVATGAKPRKLGLDGEDRFIGAGISFCAICDGEFYKGQDVAVTGGGNTALQEALYLADLCKKVYLIHRRDTFRGDQALVEAVQKRDNIECVLESTVSALSGDEKLSEISVKGADGSVQTIAISCLFEAIGHEPETDVAREMMQLDDAGYVDADEHCKTQSCGVFVAGDCRKKDVRQLTTAMSDGAVAALAACQYLDTLK